MEINLVLYKATHNANDPVCPVCFKKFSRVASLKAHIMLHEKEENLICTECGDKFTLQSQLSRHLEEHQQDLNGSRVQVCKICTKEFERPSQLREHLKSHYSVRSSLCAKQYKWHVDRSGFSHRCEHCGKTFQKPSQLIRHTRIHTGERPFKCGDCGKAFNQKGALQIHMIKHTGEKTHFCVFCPASFSQRGNLRAHIQRVHTEKKVKDGDQPAYQCEECSCVFRKLGSLNAHISRMHSDGLESSQVITDTAHSVPDAPTTRLQQTQSSTPQLHQQRMEKLSGKENVDVVKKMTMYPGSVRQLNGIRWHMCTYCTKEFKRPTDLARHIRIHTHEKPYKCTQCFRAFAVKSTLTAHMKTHTGIKEFRCPMCAKMFSTRGSLKVHHRIHTGAKPFDCPHCDKKFRTSGHRECHIYSHSKKLQLKKELPPKPAKTQILKSSITLTDIPLQEPILIIDSGSESGLSRNELNQKIEKTQQIFPGSVQQVNGIRWHMCTYCTKEFKKPSELVRHIRIHTHEKPYKCTQCFRAFAVKSTLTAHMTTHTGIKEFRCPMCAKMFTTEGNLKVHFRLHTGAKPFDCPYCDKKFRISGYRKSHIAIHFKNLQLEKRFPRKPAETQILKSSITLTDIPLQEPILIIDSDGEYGEA